jgi:PadR family transcriptional regulator, regulatory protein PadR
MISSDIIRGYNDTIILAILSKGSSYGYEISKMIKDISNEQYIIKETTLYSAFSRLEKNGYIIPFEKKDEHASRRTYYKITNLGQQYLESKVLEWETTKNVMNAFIKYEEDSK